MEIECQTLVLDAARLSAAPGGTWFHGEHEHAEAQLTVRLRVQGERAIAAESSVRIVPPYVPHRGGGPVGARSVVFHFPPKSLACVADEIYGISNFELRGGEVRDPLIVHLAEAALSELAFGSSSSLLLDYIAHVLTGRLVRAYTNLPGVRHWARTLLSAQHLRALRDFIESRFEAAITVRHLATVVGLGPHRFTAVLKASTGLTPHAYVTHLRIIRASRLLKQNQRTLAEIALTLGFAGQSHFGSVFRKYLGVTPGQYRKIMGERRLSL
jgi:AraC family transcriptional regulator